MRIFIPAAAGFAVSEVADGAHAARAADRALLDRALGEIGFDGLLALLAALAGRGVPWKAVAGMQPQAMPAAKNLHGFWCMTIDEPYFGPAVVFLAAASGKDGSSCSIAVGLPGDDRLVAFDRPVAADFATGLAGLAGGDRPKAVLRAAYEARIH